MIQHEFFSDLFNKAEKKLKEVVGKAALEDFEKRSQEKEQDKA